METQTLAAGDSRRQSASLLLLRINHMLITAQSNGVNFHTNLKYDIHLSDLQILRQAELLLQIVPDSLRFLMAIWKQVNLETAGDRRRQSQTVAGTLTIIWKPGFTETFACIKLGPAPNTKNETKIEIYNSKKDGKNAESKVLGLYILLVAFIVQVFLFFIHKCCLSDLTQIEDRLKSMDR